MCPPVNSGHNSVVGNPSRGYFNHALLATQHFKIIKYNKFLLKDDIFDPKLLFCTWSPHSAVPVEPSRRYSHLFTCAVCQTVICSHSSVCNLRVNIYQVWGRSVFCLLSPPLPARQEGRPDKIMDFRKRNSFSTRMVAAGRN